MKTFAVILVAGLMFANAAAARELEEILREKGVITADEAAEAGGDPRDLRVYWKEGIRFESADGDFKLKLGGRIHNDWAAAFSSDELVDDFAGLSSTDTGTSLRRARLLLGGTIYQSLFFKGEYDFAGGDADFRDVLIGINGLPGVGTLTLGHFREPFSLEELSSSNHITFLERGLPNIFAPSRNTGIMLSNSAASGRMTWAAGAYRDVDDFADGFGADSLYNVTGRVTGLPLYAAEGGQLLHLGLSYSHKFRNDDVIRFRQRPESSSFGARLVDSGEISSDGVDLLAPEVALVFGPLSLQGEYFQAWIDASGNDPSWHGYYVFASYFITGESRAYDTTSGLFGRLRPARDFAVDGSGWGAWEVGVRYSNLDVEQEGGELDDVTAGINWYLNPNVRVLFNYVYGDVDHSGDAHIIQGRFQVDI